MDDITFVGLDVHKATVAVAVAEGGRAGEVRRLGVVENRPAVLAKLVGRWAPAPSSRFWLSRKASPSVCRLWGDQAKSAEAYDVNAPVYGWFTGGFDASDQKPF